jgi:hypothetical protein
MPTKGLAFKPPMQDPPLPPTVNVQPPDRKIVRLSPDTLKNSTNSFRSPPGSSLTNRQARVATSHVQPAGHSYPPPVERSPSLPHASPLPPYGGITVEHGGTDALTLQMGLRNLTEADLVGKSQWELTLACNQPYAAHGYHFKKRPLFAYFSAKTWYRPTTGDPVKVDKALSALERRNAHFIRDYLTRHNPG